MSEQRNSKRVSKVYRGRPIPIPEDDWRSVDGRPLGDVVMRYDLDDARQPEITRPVSRVPDVVIVDQLPPDVDNGTDPRGVNDIVVAADGPMIIEGVATLIERVVPEHRQPTASLNQHDDIIVATLAEHHQTVNAGGTARYLIELVNNGPETSIFKVSVTGEINPSWVEIEPPYMMLAPGKRTSFEVEVKPPRTSASRASSYQMACAIDGSEYPGRQCVLHATLNIAPFSKILLGQLRSQQEDSTGKGSSTTFLVPIANQGNGSATVRLRATEISHGASPERNRRGRDQRSAFEFYNPNSDENGFGQIQVTVQAGQDMLVPLRIEPHVRPIVSLQRTVVSFRVLANVVGQNRTPQEVQDQFINKPMLGLWQLASLTGFSLVIAMGFFLGTLMLGTIFWFNSPRTESALNTQPQPAPMAIIIKVSEPVPTSAGIPDPIPTIHPTAVADKLAITEVPTRDNVVSLPTGPRPPTAPIQPQFPPAVPAPKIAVPPSQSEESPSDVITYEQMFQEIAQQYDLDWRMLAAQAYVESSFDPNAVGLDGDMGLMQIIPTTWGEWAPTVDAEDPFDSYSNAFVAATYLDYLRTQLGKRGYSDPKWMLVAYNWGPGNLFDFLEKDQPWDALDTKRKQYAQKILRISDGIPE